MSVGACWEFYRHEGRKDEVRSRSGLRSMLAFQKSRKAGMDVAGWFSLAAL